MLISNMRVVVLLVMLVACDAGKKPEPPPLPSAPASAAPSPSDAIIETQAQVIDAAPPVDPAPPIDIPKVGPNELAITWVVYPPSVPLKRDPQILQQPVSLEVLDGTVTVTTQLAPQFGNLQPNNQSACKGDAYPLAKGELAKLTFYEGGAGGFILRRNADWLSVSSWAQTDGLCGTVDKPVECPKNEKQVARINVVHVKSDAKVVERIVEVDEKGVRKPFDCGAR